MSITRSRSGVVGGVMVLTLAGLLVKVIGVFYKVPLSHLLGDEGMGYFNVSYTIYAWLYMLSTAGIPVALSIIISESRAKGDGATVRRVFRVACRALFIIGVLSTSVMLLGAVPLARLLGAQDAKYAIMAIAPTLFFICVSSLFRGVFQGYGNMTPTAISQLIEAVGKVVCGVLLASFALRRGYPIAVVSAFAVLGVTIGTAFCAGYLTLHYIYARARGEMMREETLQTRLGVPSVGYRLLSIALPVTVSASVMSLTGLIDLGMMIRRLISFGYTSAEATALYGNYTTLVVPVFNLPSVLTAPIATGIIPALSRAHAAGDREECENLLSGAFRTVGMIAVPCAMGLIAFARPILALLYPVESADSAYRLLMLLSPAVVFLCTLGFVNAALQACGSPRIPMAAMLVGGSVKVVLGYFLIGMFGVAGAPVGTMICYFTALTFGYVVLARRVGYLPSLTQCFWKPLTASILSVGTAALLYYRIDFLLMHGSGLLLCIAVAVFLYITVSFMLGAVTPSELTLLMKKGNGSERKI